MYTCIWPLSTNDLPLMDICFKFLFVVVVVVDRTEDNEVKQLS